MSGEKKRSAQGTKLRLLRAAQLHFARNGYVGTGIRDIAFEAGVNSTLLARYFGSKASLFEAALTDSINFPQIIAAGRAGFGMRLISHLADDQQGAQRLAFAIPAHDAAGTEIIARVSEVCAVRPLAEWLGGPDGRMRALKIVMLASSISPLLRYFIRVEQPSDADDRDAVLGWFAEVIQDIVDQPILDVATANRGASSESIQSG